MIDSVIKISILSTYIQVVCSENSGCVVSVCDIRSSEILRRFILINVKLITVVMEHQFGESSKQTPYKCPSYKISETSVWYLMLFVSLFIIYNL